MTEDLLLPPLMLLLLKIIYELKITWMTLHPHIKHIVCFVRCVISLQ